MNQLFDTRLNLLPTREAGLARLSAFAPSTGRKYAETRNYDYGPDRRTNVSALSPYTRTRLVLEEELVRAALDRFTISTAEKFVQEVCWRTYWKGWLERRPSVWSAYLESFGEGLDALGRDQGRKRAYDEAVNGRTGIDAFDASAAELVETGYLHNHARMWFASIWVYTLKLPWELGADFFLRHLADGDPASNTLSWRWVCGLHTQGKTYLARRANIAKYTEGRFVPTGLATEAPALQGFANPKVGPTPKDDAPPEGEIGLLLTEEDLNGETLCPPGATVKGVSGCVFPDMRSPLGAGAVAKRFAEGALNDALRAAEAAYRVPCVNLQAEDFAERASDWALSLGVRAVVTGYPPVGWVRPRLDDLKSRLAKADIRLCYVTRPWDKAFWPHAGKGFFGLKKQIPAVLAELGLPV